MPERADEPHPQAQAILDRIEASGFPKLSSVTPDEARRLFEAGFQAMRDELEYEEVGAIREFEIEGSGGPIPLRAYDPPTGGSGSPPVVVFLHGGAHVWGSHDTHDNICRALSARAEALVLSVEYRLAPEHPWPADLKDAYAALEWAADHGAELGADPDRLALVGDSAGGNLSAAAALAARDRGGPELAHQGLVCPHVAGPGQDFGSREENAEGYLLERAHLAYTWEKWVPDPLHARNAYWAPLLAQDLSGLPPATVVTAGFDPLRDEGAAYAERLEAAGVPVEHRHYPDQIHGFYSYLGLVDGADDVLDRLAEDLRRSFKGK